MPRVGLTPRGIAFSILPNCRRELRSTSQTTMATYHDPVKVFAPLEVIERLLEIRVEMGFKAAIFLFTANDIVVHLDAYGFDVFTLSHFTVEFRFGNYRAPLVPGGDHIHSLTTAH